MAKQRKGGTSKPVAVAHSAPLRSRANRKNRRKRRKHNEED